MEGLRLRPGSRSRWTRMFPNYTPPFPLYEHQLKALSRMGNGCVLRGGVGVGKSYTALAYYMRKEAPREIHVLTTARKRDELDWVNDAQQMGIGTKHSVKGAGRIHVDSWNKITDYTDVKGAFFIFDEQRLVGKGAWSKAFLKIARFNHWIMLSATPGDVWIDYAPLFIANGFYKNRSEFTKRHVVYSQWSKYPKIERYLGTAVLAKLRDQILVEMPFERNTTRHLEPVWCEYDQEQYEKVWKGRWNIFEGRPIKDIAEACRIVRLISNSDSTRSKALSEVSEKHPRLIIFYNFDYELEILRSWTSTSGKVSAEWNGHKHEPRPIGKSWVYLVQYVAGAEAWNCIETDAMCFYSLPYSYKNFEQAQGRIDRINTPYQDLWYYILRCHSPIDYGIWKSLEAKKNFNEKGFVTTHG